MNDDLEKIIIGLGELNPIFAYNLGKGVGQYQKLIPGISEEKAIESVLEWYFILSEQYRALGLYIDDDGKLKKRLEK